ncbi:response regulator [Lederbergia sp. NSJ-179]|uniref:response regulator transcription factor n=1 Tax=Lederbergia sp. NSJ-179 TaxID=2931402 RepID=UPI001FD62E2F|nr:response regulator [Lederbergia sp. NSJ-179]MCJ7841670.1 response regulator [Lederbergia sp. NSJ-179]
MFSILIVDDEWTIREGLKRTVPWKEWGIEVIGTATNGNEALEMLTRFHADILLTDIRMPGISGLELIERCRSQFPDLMLVLLTGHDEFEYAQKAIKLGADDFLLKPTNVDELEATMHSITSDLYLRQAEKNNLLALFIKDAIQHHTLQNMKKIQSFGNIRPHYGFIIVRSQAEKIVHATLESVQLIDDKVSQQVYFCHSLKNGEHWEDTIQKLKNHYSRMECHATFHVSLLSDDLNQLITLYKQANSASELYKASQNITIFQYHDDQYTLDFEKVIQYIQQHYQEAISQTELAAKLNMSNSYFSKLFKQHTGINFVDYLTLKRMEAAKELLLSTTLKTYEIAAEVGYTESRYFSQLFKKTTGLTPLQFRENGSLGKDIEE